MAVSEALRSCINFVLRDRGIIAFSTFAPTLVELTTSKVVPSRTHGYLRDFIRGHETTAVGIAGARGSGKSTLMHAVRRDLGTTSMSVFVSAPVQYEALDFTRRLYHAVAREIAGAPPENRVRQLRARIFVARVRTGVVAVVLASTILFLDIRDVVPDASGPYGPETWRDRVGPWTSLSALLAFYGGAAVVHGFLHQLRDVSRRGSVSPARLRAQEALEFLTWDIEQGQKSKNLVKVLGGALGAEDEDTLTLKRRPLSHPELVSSFRALLEEYSREPDSPSFLVFIDELDKMSEPEQLIEVVNGLKDLFHIPGVHFMVSVSTDALARFQQRGAPLRDAFDSSFDTIVEAERLTDRESLALIDARAAGFPPLLALLCHAWSGGLPRDLLRAARRCVEIQRAESSALPLAAIQRALVLGDLLALTESLLRTRAGASATAPRIGGRPGPQADSAASQVRCVVKSVLSGEMAPDDAFGDCLAQQGDDADVDHGRLLDIGRNSFALLAVFERVAVTIPDSEALASAEIGRVADAFAHAVALQGEPAVLRHEAAAEALAVARGAGLLATVEPSIAVHEASMLGGCACRAPTYGRATHPEWLEQS